MLSTLASYIPFTKSNPQGLVLMGGGMFGAAYLGAIKRLRELNRIDDVTHYAGSSVGSLVALLVAANCDLDVVAAIPPMSILSDESLLEKMTNITNRFGFNSTLSLRKIIGDALESSLGVRDVTFAELHKRTGNSLYVTATEIYRELCREATYSLQLTPDCSCVDAVIQSSTYPLFFTASKHPDLPCIMADGGILNNYPINLLQVESIGIVIERDEPTQLTLPNGTVEYLLSIIGELHRRSSTATRGPDTIVIHVSGSCLNFTMDVDHLIKLGYDAVK